MCTKYWTCRIFHILIRIVSCIFYYFLCVMAWHIPSQAAYKPSKPSRICCYFLHIAWHKWYWCFSRKNLQAAICHWPFKCPLHPLYIVNCPSYRIRGHFKPEVIIWLKQYIFCLHKPLSYSTVCCLPEITTFCMFKMCLSCNKSNLYICNCRTCKHSWMFSFINMWKYKILPIPVKVILFT